MGGWSGYMIIVDGKGYCPSAKIMRQIAKYLKHTTQDLQWDYFYFQFEAITDFKN